VVQDNWLEVFRFWEQWEKRFPVSFFAELFQTHHELTAEIWLNISWLSRSCKSGVAIFLQT